MNKVLIIFIFLLQPSIAMTSESNVAKISGETYLGVPGNISQIAFKDKRCAVESNGADKNKDFKIVFTCNGTSQVLWDINIPVAGDFSFDDPKFYLLWAGDKDNDGKIDIVMDMSPKYSCTKEVTYLSSKASKGQLLGISGNPKTVCF